AARRGRGELGCGLARLLLDRARKAAPQALVQHERLEHVAGHGRSADAPNDPRAALSATYERHVADARIADGLAGQRDALAALEQRLGDDEAAALREHGNDRLDRTAPGARRTAHFRSPTSTRRATGSA